MSPRKQGNIQRSLTPCLRMVHPKKYEVRQKCQKVHVDEQIDSGQIQTQKKKHAEVGSKSG